MSDNSKEKRKFADMVNRNKGEAQSNNSNDKANDLNEDLNILKERAAQLEDHLRRAVADNENIKRIMQKQISDASDYAITNLAKETIDWRDLLKTVIDNLKDDDPISEGIKAIYQKITNDLKKYGIEEIHPLNEPFDSNVHQAVVEKEDNEKDPGTIVEVLQTGYMIKGRLLRPAMVIISKKSG